MSIPNVMVARLAKFDRSEIIYVVFYISNQSSCTLSLT